MAERPLENQNWQGRSFQCFGPKFRLDMNNPQMGLNGTDVYSFYGVTNNGDVSVTGLDEGGLYKIYNNQSIEIVGGQTASANGVDILIAGKSGDIWIQAEKNGKVRIRGANITIDADENLDIIAGKTVTIKSSRFLVQANQADCDSLTGNLTPNKSSFIEQVFEGTYVGADILSKFSGGVIGLF